MITQAQYDTLKQNSMKQQQAADMLVRRFTMMIDATVPAFATWFNAFKVAPKTRHKLSKATGAFLN